jgi:hypothetical protein
MPGLPRALGDKASTRIKLIATPCDSAAFMICKSKFYFVNGALHADPRTLNSGLIPKAKIGLVVYHSIGNQGGSRGTLGSELGGGVWQWQ